MEREKLTAFPGAYAGQKPGETVLPQQAAPPPPPPSPPPLRPEEPKTSPWVWAMRIAFTVGLAWTVVFIFRNSLEIAEVSSARSQQIMETLNRGLGLLGLGPLSEHIVRKLAHFSEFALLGFWFMLCLRVYTRRFVRHVGWPLFFGLFVANVDELIQLYVPGRSSSVRDVMIDFLGVLAGLFAALLLLLLVRMCRILWRNRREL